MAVTGLRDQVPSLRVVRVILAVQAASYADIILFFPVRRGVLYCALS